MSDAVLRGKRGYQFPQPAYALVQDVKARLGVLAACEVECVLSGKTNRFYNIDSDQLRIVRALAGVRGIQLP